MRKIRVYPLCVPPACSRCRRRHCRPPSRGADFSGAVFFITFAGPRLHGLPPILRAHASEPWALRARRLSGPHSEGERRIAPPGAKAARGTLPPPEKNIYRFLLPRRRFYAENGGQNDQSDDDGDDERAIVAPGFHFAFGFEPGERLGFPSLGRKRILGCRRGFAPFRSRFFCRFRRRRRRRRRSPSFFGCRRRFGGRRRISDALRAAFGRRIGGIGGFVDGNRKHIVVAAALFGVFGRKLRIAVEKIAADWRA